MKECVTLSCENDQSTEKFVTTLRNDPDSDLSTFDFVTHCYRPIFSPHWYWTC